MKKICLFSGTSEGRELAFSLARYEAELTVCTATGYGGSLSASPRARVCAGEMDCSEMERFFEREKFDCVIDATHPHARAVTQNIRDAAFAANVKCFRVLRGLPAPDSDAVCVRSASEAAAYLSARNGRIFLTTGSRSLAAFAELADRIVARVLPRSESLRECEAIGLTPAQIIAMQGPFDEKENDFLMERYPCEWLVTKQAGQRGGTDAKIASAKRRGMGVVLILSPETEGESPSAVLQKVVREFKLARREQNGI